VITQYGGGGVTRIPLHEIEPIDRYRKDMGDINALADSIRELGLIQPVVVMEMEGSIGVLMRYRLIAGERRVNACRSLGWHHVPACVVKRLDDAAALLRAQRDENTCRKDFTPSEAVALGKALEEIERKKAKERQGGAGRDRSSKLYERSKGRTDDRVAEAVGMKKDTYRKAKAVVDAAEADPALQPVVEQMDRSGKVDPAFKKVKKIVAKVKHTPTPTKMIDLKVTNTTAPPPEKSYPATALLNRWLAIVCGLTVAITENYGTLEDMLAKREEWERYEVAGITQNLDAVGREFQRIAEQIRQGFPARGKQAGTKAAKKARGRDGGRNSTARKVR
jgi:ParB family chromosome partitioning protein